MATSSARVPARTRSSSLATTCTSSNAKSTTPTRGRGGTLRPVIQAGPIAEPLDSSEGEQPFGHRGRISATPSGELAQRHISTAQHYPHSPPGAVLIAAGSRPLRVMRRLLGPGEGDDGGRAPPT